MFHFNIDPEHMEELMRRLKEIQDEVMRKLLYGDPDKPWQEKFYYGTSLFESLERLEESVKAINRYGSAASEHAASLRDRRTRAAEIDGGE